MRSPAHRNVLAHTGLPCVFVSRSQDCCASQKGERSSETKYLAGETHQKSNHTEVLFSMFLL